MREGATARVLVAGLEVCVSAGVRQCEWARSLAGRERPDARAVRWGAQSARRERGKKGREAFYVYISKLAKVRQNNTPSRAHCERCRPLLALPSGDNAPVPPICKGDQGNSVSRDLGLRNNQFLEAGRPKQGGKDRSAMFWVYMTYGDLVMAALSCWRLICDI